MRSRVLRDALIEALFDGDVHVAQQFSELAQTEAGWHARGSGFVHICPICYRATAEATIVERPCCRRTCEESTRRARPASHA
jgi:hypothetical protein